MNLLDRYAALTAELAKDHLELADVLVLERKAKVQAWERSGQSSMQGRDREADATAFSYTKDVLELKGAIAAREAEIQWIRDLLARDITEWVR